MCHKFILTQCQTIAKVGLTFPYRLGYKHCIDFSYMIFRGKFSGLWLVSSVLSFGNGLVFFIEYLSLRKRLLESLNPQLMLVLSMN